MELHDRTLANPIARRTWIYSQVILLQFLTGTDYFNLAGLYAQAAGAAQRDQDRSQAERAMLSDQYADHAMELLAKAAAAGYFKDAATIEAAKADSDLATLRSRPDLKKLIADLKQKAKPPEK